MILLIPTGNLQNQHNNTIITLNIKYRIRLVEDVVSTCNIRDQNHQCWCRYSDVGSINVKYMLWDVPIYSMYYLRKFHVCVPAGNYPSFQRHSCINTKYLFPTRMRTSTKESSNMFDAWWKHLQPYPLHLFNLLILVDNETVPSLLYVVLCNCKTGYGYIQHMHPKTQWYLMLCVTLTGFGRGHGQSKIYVK